MLLYLICIYIKPAGTLVQVNAVFVLPVHQLYSPSFRMKDEFKVSHSPVMLP